MIITTITVSVENNGRSIIVKWIAPIARIDGTALAESEIGGYRVFYYLDGTPATQATIADISGNTLTFTSPLLAHGTYHFAVLAYETDGVNSDLSNEGDVLVE